MSTLNAITSGAGGVALSGDTSGNLVIQSAGTNVATFTTGGNLTFSVANAGIQFNKSGGLTNTVLNDYEEGTFTPTVTGSSTNPTITYGQQSGTYTKIGNLVYVAIQLGLTSRSGGSGNWQVNLPFTSLSDSLYYGGFIGTIYGFTHSSGQNQWGGRIQTGTAIGGIWDFNGTGGGDSWAQISTQGTGQCYLTMSFIYRV